MIKKKLTALLLSFIAIFAIAVPVFADTVIDSRPSYFSQFGYNITLRSYVGGNSTRYYGGVKINCSPGVYWDAFIGTVNVRNAAEGNIIKTSVSGATASGGPTYFYVQTPSSSTPYTNYLTVDASVKMYDEQYQNSYLMYTNYVSGGGFRSASIINPINVNKSGQTYGFLPTLGTHKPIPDLIEVTNSDGKTGYVYSSSYFDITQKVEKAILNGDKLSNSERLLQMYTFEGQPLGLTYHID